MNPSNQQDLASKPGAVDSPRSYSADEWEAQKDRIESLYYSQRLSDVVRIMGETYKFYARERQYKTRIKLWKFDKNIREEDMLVMLRMREQRKLKEGKSSQFTIRGRPVKMAKLDRFQRARKVTDLESAGDSATEIPPYIDCRTPPSEPTITNQSTHAHTCTGVRQPTDINSAPSPQNRPLHCQMDGSECSTNFSSESPRHIDSIFSLDTPALQSDSQPNNPETWAHNQPTRCESSINTGFEDMFTSVPYRSTMDRRNITSPEMSEHLKALRSKAIQAKRYNAQGRYRKAEDLELHVLEERKRILGEKHPTTLLVKVDLAATYWGQRRFREAEELEVEVLDARKELFGEEHVDTLRAKLNVAKTYHHQGRYREAEILEMQVLEVRKRLLGEKHPATLHAKVNLAATYWSQEKFEEAEELETQVLKTRVRKYGEEHPKTLLAKEHLSATYRSQKRFEEAEKLDIEVLETRRRKSGEKHPDTLFAKANLGATYQQKWMEAELANSGLK